jgi:hypothetical protein
MKRLLLVRHGSVKRPGWQLNDGGRLFAAKLPDLLSLDCLDCICSDESDRCKDTVAPLAEKFSLSVTSFRKGDFESCTVLSYALRHSTSVVCYRIEAVNPLLAVLGLPQFTQGNRNTAYEFIWDVRLNDSGVVDRAEKLPTGFGRDGRQEGRTTPCS